MEQNSKLPGHFALAAAYIIFSLNIVFCKDIANSETISPMALFSCRAIGACFLFWLISFFLPEEKVDPGDFWKIALASTLGLFIPQVAFLKAITMTTAIDTAIVSTLAPIFTMFIAAIFLKEPITVKKAGGVALSFAGVLFLIFNSVTAGNGVTHSRPFGIVLMLINNISFASYLGIFRPLISKYSVITFMKWMFLFALLLSLPFSASDLASTRFSSMPVNVMLEIGFVIFFATFVAYFLIPLGQKRLRPTICSMYSYMQPIVASLIAIVIGMDVLSWQKVAATLLVISGVVIVNGSRAASK